MMQVPASTISADDGLEDLTADELKECLKESSRTCLSYDVGLEIRRSMALANTGDAAIKEDFFWMLGCRRGVRQQ